MKILFSILGLLLLALSNSAQAKPGMSDIDRVRIAEAFRIGQTIGNRLWKDWDKAPFAVLLVTPENEFLVRHPKPTSDFISLGHDALLKSDVYFRKRTFGTNLLATFPAVGGVSTTVIGQAENTSKKTSSAWVVTLLHEHFHQLQMSQPNYYADVNALDLSNGDNGGMWMLDYPFPYSSSDVKQQVDGLARLLAGTLQTNAKTEFSAKVTLYLEERQKLEAMLKPKDYKYFSFQLWQEGVARYTEYRIADLAARKYKPGKQFQALKDYRSFNKVANEIMENIVNELKTLQLDTDKRVAFYPMGAGEALLLDRTNPKWKRHYFAEKFYLDKYFVR